eukprot:6202759-Alexandrium_andersonii.AAC.1
MGPRSSRGVRFAAFPAQNPNLTTTKGVEGVRTCESARLHTPIRNPPGRNPRNPLLFGREKPEL